MTGRECPTGCGRRVEVGKLMCPSCWRKVPDHLQRDVNVSWRAFNRRASEDPADRRRVRQAYADARDAAISAASPAPERVHHNHVTRSILPRGQCPACDEIHRKSDERLAKDPTRKSKWP